jgi:hypothetical protein
MRVEKLLGYPKLIGNTLEFKPKDWSIKHESI